MNAALLALSLLAADGVDTDPDFLAPFLGMTLVDAEDLAREAADPLEPGGRGMTMAGPLPAAAPVWAALLPTLSVELVRRQVRQLSGSDVLGLSSGTLLLIQATFGLAGGERRSIEDRDRAAPGLRLALASRAANPGTLAITRGLPSIAEIQRATEQAALVRLADLDGWRSRARASAWLPELGLSYQRNVGEIDTLGIQSNLGVDSHNIEDVTRYGVRASWQLGQLVFSREEVAAAKTALEVQRDRQELVAHVTELYFEWLRRRAPAANAGENAQEALGLAEVEAKIDALTDGFLSRRLRELEER